MPDGVLQNHYYVAALQHPFPYNGGMSLSVNQQGGEPEPATRRAAAPRWARGRIGRAFFLMAAALAAAGLLAACGNDSVLSVRDSTALAVTSSTISGLDQAGYRNAGLGLQAGSGLSADGLADVSYSSGPAATAEANARNAERIVWNTLPYRFGTLTVSQTSGECAPGSFCESSSTQIASQTYAQLRGEFGPRPAGLDKTSASQAALALSWLPGAAAVSGFRPGRRATSRRAGPPRPRSSPSPPAVSVGPSL